MKIGPDIARIAVLIGDPARANILTALLDGRALTATELALHAGVSPQTTSGHLAKLEGAGLVVRTAQGRHRYVKLAGPDVASAIEALHVLADKAPKPTRLPSKLDPPMRAARTCYDHLAGRLGVALTDSMLARKAILPDGARFAVPDAGSRFFDGLGIDVAALRAQRRRFACPCLDWSERRPHLAGSLGAAVADACFARGWVERRRRDRSVAVSPAGAAAFAKLFGVDAAAVAAAAP